MQWKLLPIHLLFLDQLNNSIRILNIRDDKVMKILRTRSMTI